MIRGGPGGRGGGGYDISDDRMGAGTGQYGSITDDRGVYRDTYDDQRRGYGVGGALDGGVSSRSSRDLDQSSGYDTRDGRVGGGGRYASDDATNGGGFGNGNGVGTKGIVSSYRDDYDAPRGGVSTSDGRGGGNVAQRGYDIDRYDDDGVAGRTGYRSSIAGSRDVAGPGEYGGTRSDHHVSSGGGASYGFGNNNTVVGSSHDNNGGGAAGSSSNDPYGYSGRSRDEGGSGYGDNRNMSQQSAGYGNDTMGYQDGDNGTPRGGYDQAGMSSDSGYGRSEGRGYDQAYTNGSGIDNTRSSGQQGYGSNANDNSNYTSQSTSGSGRGYQNAPLSKDSNDKDSVGGDVLAGGAYGSADLFDSYGAGQGGGGGSYSQYGQSGSTSARTPQGTLYGSGTSTKGSGVGADAKGGSAYGASSTDYPSASQYQTAHDNTTSTSGYGNSSSYHTTGGGGSSYDPPAGSSSNYGASAAGAGAGQYSSSSAQGGGDTSEYWAQQGSGGDYGTSGGNGASDPVGSSTVGGGGGYGAGSSSRAGGSAGYSW